jgi:hypothetical protein
LEFEWDSSKAAKNEKKHRVTFNEARTVFDDPRVIYQYDEKNSNGEDRFIAIGLSDKGRLLQVSHVDRGVAIRIISARKASPNQEKAYA